MPEGALNKAGVSQALVVGENDAGELTPRDATYFLGVQHQHLLMKPLLEEIPLLSTSE